ncbi:C25 family cysteine peptidase [Pseudobacteriovorax antillogorgiicola]|uniref:Propeptide_C25 n=1 Tax=Pseudobacteriovorax antillogorgiicola TaxID=1513793 RepID=A0A1Y6BZ63_9BACT|nr:C25 family cysteine peptidase [Pseudobacteriovorax antillogorgiicola]TCS52956.1 peptidase C25-like protein [Pseudobacteriovorax antillogorgiicola]SMF27551.1 Propeptide_C25 [Pseudobacteriovorax antillogorgiicola]
MMKLAGLVLHLFLIMSLSQVAYAVADDALIDILEDGIASRGDVWPPNFSALGVMIEHPKHVNLRQMSCFLADSKRRLFSLKAVAQPCSTCRSDRTKSLVSFYGVLSPRLSYLKLKCQYQGLRDLEVKLYRKKPFRSFPWAAGYVKEQDWWSESMVRKIQSGKEGLHYEIIPPKFKFTKVETPFGMRQRLVTDEPGVHGLFGRTYESTAEVPVLSHIVAIPKGASIKDISIQSWGEETVKNIDLYPVQKGRADHPGFKLIEIIDKEKFLQGDYRVNKPILVQALKTSEGNLYKIVHPLVSYNPKRRELTRYQGFTVDVKYDKSYKCYWPLSSLEKDPIDRLIQRRSQVLREQMINRDSLSSICFNYLPIIPRLPIKPLPILRPLDLQDSKDLIIKPKLPLPIAIALPDPHLVIIYPSRFREQVNDLVKHKRRLGIRSRMVSTEVISRAEGSLSATAIKNTVRKIYAAAKVKPRWLLLFGDAEFIPPYYFKEGYNFYDESFNAGDTYYGQMSGDLHTVPELAVGRLPVDHEDEAAWAVSKIKRYELNPQLTPRFYNSSAISASFIDRNRDGVSDSPYYAEFIEKRLSPWIRDAGKGIDRVYKASEGSSPSYWSDRSPLAATLHAPTFNWSAGLSEFMGQLSLGSHVQMHRGHGWFDKLYMPDVSVSDLGNLERRLSSYQTFFLGINCASGFFDNETVLTPENNPHPDNGRYDQFIYVSDDPPRYDGVYFAESLVKRLHGPIAYLGDSRASYSELNNVLAEGLSKSLFDQNARGLSLGELHNLGKAHLLATYSDRDTFSLKEHQLIYNLLGDPSLRFWTEAPLGLRLKDVKESWEERDGEYQRRVTGSIQMFDPYCSDCLEGWTTQRSLFQDRQLVVTLVGEDNELISEGVVGDDGRIDLPAASWYQKNRATLTVSGNHVKPVTQEMSFIYIY